MIAFKLTNIQELKNFFKPHVNKYIPNLCMAGINIINKKLLSFIEPKNFKTFQKIFKENEKKMKIYCYNTREYIKDAGTPDRIKQIKKELKTFKFKNGNINRKIPCNFFR